MIITISVYAILSRFGDRSASCHRIKTLELTIYSGQMRRTSVPGTFQLQGTDMQALQQCSWYVNAAENSSTQ